MVGFTYPKELYDAVKALWHQKLWKREIIPPLPPKEVIQKIIDVVFHASFLTEEKRRIWFRVVYVSKRAMEKRSKQKDADISIIEFYKPRIFNVNELVKLAPAADPTQVLIGVYKNRSKKDLEIWGLIEAGTSWWDFQRHESSMGRPPPNAFTVSSMKPGQISISRQGSLLLILDQGKIIGASSWVLRRGPVAEFLEKGAGKLYKEACKKLKHKCWDQERIDDDYPKRFYIMFLERILNRIRERFHGGTLIMIPDEMDINDTRLQDRIVIKYPCSYDAWASLIDELVKYRKYFDLHFKLWDKKKITQDEFRQMSVADRDYKESEEMTKRAAAFLSSFSAVDGAVVITDKLRLLGFGAEIIAISPSLSRVKVITSFEKNIGEYRDIELFGTRHRSAFRFCSSFEDSVAFVVSQDGEIRVAKRVGSEVILWSNINIATLGF